MDINKLVTLLPEMAIFVNVVESGSFSKTAQILGVAPSSVSRSITRLESVLERKLLERSTRKMRLSVAGQEVYGLCADMLQAAKMAVSAAQADKGEVAGVLRVAAPKALSRLVLMPLVLDFLAEYPRVILQLKVADHYIDPIGDAVDVIIHITDKPVEGLVARTLGRSNLVLCASPLYLQSRNMPTYPDELVEHNCLCLGESPRDQMWEFTRGIRTVSVRVKGSLAVNHSEIRREAVLRGMGISVFPEFAIHHFIASGELIELLSDWRLGGNYQGQILAQYAQSKYVPLQIKTFIAYLQQRMALNSQ
ncbi:MAG: LysR family transcriptional regulator [Plesiomonas sp.]